MYQTLGSHVKRLIINNNLDGIESNLFRYNVHLYCKVFVLGKIIVTAVFFKLKQFYN